MATVMMCDLDGVIAATVFEMLNEGKVYLLYRGKDSKPVLVTDIDPEELTYPEAWYYSKGFFTNKNNTINGLYDQIEMQTRKRAFWGDIKS